MSIVVTGILKNGRLKLLETPQGLRDGRVRVTLEEEVAPPENFYPPELIATYQELTRKQRLHSLTLEEARRLETVQRQLDELDALNPTENAWREPCRQIGAELEQIRRDIETLKNA